MMSMTALTAINAGLCALMTLALCWLIMSPAVKDGVIIKLGLITAALGFLGASLALVERGPTQWDPLLTAALAVWFGMFVAGAGVAVRIARDPEIKQLAFVITGYPQLDDNPGA